MSWADARITVKGPSYGCAILNTIKETEKSAKTMRIENVLYSLNISELEDEATYSYWYERMKDERKKKIDAMKPRSGKLLSLGAGVLLEKAMEEVGISDYEIAYGEREKPYIKGHKDVYFNLSHSKDMVVLALSDKEIGVDTERYQHFKDSLINYVFDKGDINLAKDISETMTYAQEEIIFDSMTNGSTKDISKTMTVASETDANEIQEITSSDKTNKKEAITSLDKVYTMFWTMKESIMKHSGMGISLEPKKIRLFHGDGFFTAEAEKYDCSGLKLFSYEKGSYQITVCTGYDSFPDVTDVKL